MNTTQLECFLAVAQNLNFSKAAASVALTQPAVSHQIRSLEEELGVQLFTRTSKSVALTRAGMQFIGDASAILRIAKSARTRLNEPQTQNAVFLGLGCHNHHELDLVPSMLRRLHEEFPTLRPNLRIAPAHALQGLLENETLHALLGFYNEQHPASFSGLYEELCRCPVVCLCDENHPLAEREWVAEEDLTGSMILCGPYREPDALLHLHFRAAAGRPAAEVYVSEGYDGCIAMIKAGLGFSVFPYLPTLEEPGLRCIPLRGFPLIPFGAYLKSSSSPVVRRFLAIAREELRVVEEVGAQ